MISSILFICANFLFSTSVCLLAMAFYYQKVRNIGGIFDKNGKEMPFSSNIRKGKKTTSEYLLFIQGILGILISNSIFAYLMFY